MLLSRKWLDEFVHVDANDKDFAEAMTLSGSKVETVTALNESLKNVVVGQILSMEKHPDSDHMWICQIDVGQAEPTQIVTGAWNIHVGDLVPVAQHKSLLPGGVKIEKGKLRGVLSNGMLCSLKELNLTAEHDYPYAVITPAALLNDYHPIDKDKPSIPADIKPGDKVTIVEPSVYPDELVNPLCAELEKYPMVGAAYLQIMVINGATKSYLLVLDAPKDDALFKAAGDAVRPFLVSNEKKMNLNITISTSPLGQQGMRGSEPFYIKGQGRVDNLGDDED
mgnify:CR=1 FL=1